jgi:ribosome-associated heat shock protein Hsp15
VPVDAGDAVRRVDLEHAWKYAGVRVDSWLWVARLARTRGLAAEALRAGRVTVDGVVAKPSRPVKPGDLVVVRTGAVRRAVVVRAVAARRGPAAEAALLYEETPESIRARLEAAAERRAAGVPSDPSGGRPTKRDRRRLDRARGRR